MDARPTVQQRLRYAFDNTMARGTPALVGWLALVTLALIAFFTAIVLIADLAPGNRPGPRGAVGQAFESLLHALDPGTIAGDPGGHWPFLIVMLFVTLGGLFVVSALIGVIATGLDSRIDELRKGRSVVLEEGHTLILGWSDTVFTDALGARDRQREPQAALGGRPRRTRQGRDGRPDPREGGAEADPRDQPQRLADRPQRPRPGAARAGSLDRRPLAGGRRGSRRAGDQDDPRADQRPRPPRPPLPHRRRDPRPCTTSARPAWSAATKRS